MAVQGGNRFGRYRFHPTQGLTRGKREVKVTPKSLAVLERLIERPGEVVTRDELFRDVWPDTVVSDAALTTCIQELRRALVDDARRPKYIETVHRRGFRFVAKPQSDAAPISHSLMAVASARRDWPIVGRDGELRRLADALATASAGRRQIVFVTGEPGIGKTALLDAWLGGLAREAAYRIARAECLDHCGAGEAYQPLLDALARLCRQPDGSQWLATLRRCAPSWLAQAPSLVSQEEHLVLQRRAGGTTTERMIRELTDGFEAMTNDAALVLCLEDLHWADASTLDWIASFARRPEPARALVIGTYRPGERSGDRGSPEALARELGVRGLCSEIALGPLDRDALCTYVFTRFPPAPSAVTAFETLTDLVARRTEGHPLFVVNVLTDLVARGALAMHDGVWTAPARIDAELCAIPVDVERAVERQIDRLEENQQHLLEVASLVDGACPAALVAAAAGLSPTDVQVVFDGLVRRYTFIRQGPAIEWPDGTISGSCEFLHALYRDVLRARLSPGRRIELHRRIAVRLESAYGTRAQEMAVELARHFEEARDPRAVAYLQHAAEIDRSRSAHVAARHGYERALALLERMAPDVARDEREIALRLGLGSILMQTSGWGAPEVEAIYARVRALSEMRHPDQPALPAIWNLWIYYITRGEIAEARGFADRLTALAERSGDLQALLQAHHARWSTWFTLGDLQGAEAHARHGLSLSERVHTSLEYGGHDTAICARLFCARVLAYRGLTDSARAIGAEAVQLARALDHPFTLAFALMHVAAIHETCRDAAGAGRHAAEATRVAEERGLGQMRAWAAGFLGWSMAQLGETAEGLKLTSEAVAFVRAKGVELFLPHLLGLQASALASSRRVADALATIEDALAVAGRTGERFHEAELRRKRGELWLTLASDNRTRRRAREEFDAAKQLAEAQGAYLIALRAAVNLARLPSNARHGLPSRLVRTARALVVEGHTLPDILEADALIGELSLGRSRSSSSPADASRHGE